MGLRREAQAMDGELGSGDVLGVALADARAGLSTAAARELVDDLLERRASSDELAEWLVAAGAHDPERRQLLGDVLGSVARRLAYADGAPTDGAAAAAWQALVTA